MSWLSPAHLCVTWGKCLAISELCFLDQTETGLVPLNVAQAWKKPAALTALGPGRVWRDTGWVRKSPRGEEEEEEGPPSVSSVCLQGQLRDQTLPHRAA